MSNKMHYFDVDEAILFGERASIILNHIRSWIFKNKSSNRNFHDGHFWTYNTIAGFKEYYPYLSDKQISTVLNKLEKDGILKTGNYNKMTFDRTKWYCINEPLIILRKLELKKLQQIKSPKGEFDGANEQLDSFLQENCILPFGKMEEPKWENVNLPNGKIEDTQTVNTIPDILTDNKTYNKTKERGKILKNFVPPSLSEISNFIKKENIKHVSADAFLNFYNGNGWMVGKNKMKSWESTAKSWEVREIEKQRKTAPIPAVKNVIVQKETEERKPLEENFKKKVIVFGEQLKTNATVLEHARIKFNKECNYPFEFNSQAVYNHINDYMMHSINNISRVTTEGLDISSINFENSFIRWFKLQKHNSSSFSETPNRWHKSPELQQ